MDSLMSALISAIVTTIGIGLAYLRWRKDVDIRREELRNDFNIRREELREEITAELVRQRVKPYSEFMKNLKSMSAENEKEIRKNPHKALDFVDVLQDAIYGEVGLLASNVTRGIIVYARKGCKDFAESKIDFPRLKQHFWAIHNGLRSDLGISQSDWPDEIERVRSQADDSNREIEELVQSIPDNQYR